MPKVYGGNMRATLFQKNQDEMLDELLDENFRRAWALVADKVVFTLFDKSTGIEMTDAIYHQAFKRVHVGNPPGKEGSLGDAINWESILFSVTAHQDIFIVSGDRDYKSALSEKNVNEFLRDEWNSKKHSFVHFYPKISDFFKTKFPNIKVASEIERDLLIAKLAKSPSFADTHVIVAELSQYTDFSPGQAERLIEVAIYNNQVGWIMSDDDVHEFYKSLYDKHKDQVREAWASALKDMLTPAKPAPSHVPF